MNLDVLKILIIENNSDYLIQLKIVTKDAFPDAILLIAVDFKTGLDIAAQQDPDVILIGTLYDPKEQCPFCKIIQADEKLRDIPIILLFPSDEDEVNRLHALEFGADSFIAYPISKSEFTAQIRVMARIKVSNVKKRSEQQLLDALVAKRIYELERTHGNTLNLLHELHQENENRKKSEIALKESEKRFQILAEVSPVGIFRTDPDGVTTYVNPRWSSITGLERDEALGDGWLKAVHPEDREKLFNGWKNATHDHQESTSEYRFVRPDGKTVWVMGRAVFERNFENEIVGYLGTITDITERKEMELSLKESEIQYRYLFSQNPAPMLIYELGSLNLLAVNDAFISHYGYSQSEALSLKLTDLYPETEKSPIAKLSGELHGHAYVGEWHHLKKDGTQITIEAHSHGFIFNDREARIAVITDITERKKIEDALRESEEKFKFAFHTSPDSVNINSLSDGKYIEINEGFTRITGYTKEDVIGKSSFEINIWENQEQRSKLVEGLRERGRIDNLETKFRMKDGKIIHGLMSAAIILLKDKPHILSITKDITARKLGEEELQKSYVKTKELETIINRSPAVAFLWKAEENWTVEYVSENVIQFGYTPEELLTGKTLLSSIVYPEDLHRVVQEVSDYSKLEVNEFNQEYRILTKSGDVRYVDDRTWIRRDNEGKITHYQGIMLDITKRKLSEEAVKKNEKMLRLFIENSPAAIAMFDTEMKYVIASHRFVADYNLGEQNLAGRSHYDVFPEMTERWKEIHKRCLAGATERCDEDPFPRADGKVDWVKWEIRPWYERENEIGGIILFSEVITDRKNADEELRTANNRLTDVLENMNDAFVSLDRNWCYSYMNEKAGKIFNRNPKDMIGKHIWTEFPEGIGQPFQRNYEKAMNENIFIRIEEYYPPYDKWFENRINPTEDGIAIFFSDITERKKAEDEIKRSREELHRLTVHLQDIREEERKSLAREMHDEIGQILTSIKMNLSFLRRQVEAGEKKIKIKELDKEIQSMSGMVDHAVVRVRKIITELRPELLDKLGLIPALEWFIEEFAKETKIKCEYKFTVQNLGIDQHKKLAVFRIVQETLTNVARHANATKVKVSIKKTNHEIIVEIKDNGVGISDEKRKGENSFGLLGMRERATITGGTLEISGVEGKGTTVKLIIGQ
ncbi:MAG: PAS domain S-box protein [Ignavibacteria bacterium]|nr:PAS domain S-box protein [Ignavibacteria bacterium]